MKLFSRFSLSLSFSLFFFSLTFAQNVKTKDGVSLGERKSFIKSCTKGADEGTMKVNGIEINTLKYCSCVCDKLIPTINSYDLEAAYKNNKITELFLEEKNFKIVMGCLEGNYKIDESYTFSDSSNTDLVQRTAISTCVETIMGDKENLNTWNRKMAEDYCNCAVTKLYSKGYTYKDIQSIEDETSPAYNEIAVPCMNEAMKSRPADKSSNSYTEADIRGDVAISKVELIDYLGQGYKVKITIDGITKYYLFDTGASDLIIDREMERELLINGSIKKSDYLDIQEYTMANNEVVKGQMVRLKNVKIGDFTVNNVVGAVIENGSLLCGKGFLDKFKKWELDKEKKLLILYK